MVAIRRPVAAAVVPALALVGVAQPAQADSPGARLCADLNLTGPCLDVRGPNPDVTGFFGGNGVTSLQAIDPSAKLTVWDQPNYQGRCQVFKAETINDLRGSWVGDNGPRSVGVSLTSGCSGSSAPPGVIRATSKTGAFAYLSNSIPDLVNTGVGDNSLQKLQIVQPADGWIDAAVYSEPNYQGLCASIRVNTGIHVFAPGDLMWDRASSIAFNHFCKDDVRLCEHENGGGKCVSFRTDSRDLRFTDIGDNQASSVVVPAGWDVTVYEHPNYGGVYDLVPDGFYRWRYSTDFTQETWLINFPGSGTNNRNDALSSIHLRSKGDPSCPPGPSYCKFLIFG